MALASPGSPAPVRTVERWGYAALAGAVVLSAGAWWLGVTGEVPLLALAPPAALLLGLAVASAPPSRPLALAVVVGSSVALLGGDRGVTAAEVVFGVLAYGYLVLWTVRAVAAREGVLRSGTDVAAALWCTLGIGGGVVLGALFGADPYDFRADLQAALFFPFYFPVKEVVRRHAVGARLVGALVVGLGVVAAVMTAVHVRAALAEATAVYEIVDVRGSVGQTMMGASLVLSLAALTVARRRLLGVGLLVALGVTLGGIVIDKSRALWVALLLAVVLLGLLSRGSERRRLAVAAGGGAVLLVAAALVVLGRDALLIGIGVLNRFSSLGAAGTDISLLNRFAESRAAFAQILDNPILGHGWGVQITYYSPLGEGTQTWAFLHNGYLALWHKLGLWGLLLMTGVWFSTVVQGAWTSRTAALDRADRAVLNGTVAVLAVFAITAITSNPFSLMDQMLTLAVLLGLANGIVERERDQRAAR